MDEETIDVDKLSMNNPLIEETENTFIKLYIAQDT